MREPLPATIRPALPADAEAISALMKSLSAFYLVRQDDAHAERFFAATSPARVREQLRDPAMRMLVAEIEGRFAGFVSTRDARHVLQFYVEPAFQARRVGRQLWDRALAGLRAGGASHDITVDASVFAVPVYGRFGFELAGERTTQHGVTYVPMVLRGDAAAP